MNSHATSIAAAATAKPPPQQPQIAAPQLKIAEDGTIVINEESLVIQREAIEPVYDSTIVEESELNEKLTYNSYRKFHHSKKWTSIG
jgi:transcription factor TFIIIB component B''